MSQLSPQVGNIKSLVIYSDNAAIVLNKPAEIAVHKTPKGDSCLEDYFHQLCQQSERVPSLAHRLDKSTSGCLLLGRTEGALARLGKLFQQGKIKKRYIAMVCGSMPDKVGEISAPIKRVDLGRGKWQFTIADDGQQAVTRYTVLARSANHSLLSLEPLTGRTHQLRLHCQHVGCPIVGDGFYGGGEGFLHLHAFQLYVPAGSGCVAIDVAAPLPSHLSEALALSGMETPAPIALASNLR